MFVPFETMRISPGLSAKSRAISRSSPLQEPAEADRFDVLSTLIEAYEDRHHSIPEAGPVDVLRYAIDELGHTQAELASLLGSKSRASEILSGKRRLTLEMIQAISAAWRISVAALVPAMGGETAAA